jgi:hypothetical protein
MIRQSTRAKEVTHQMSRLRVMDGWHRLGSLPGNHGTKRGDARRKEDDNGVDWNPVVHE